MHNTTSSNINNVITTLKSTPKRTTLMDQQRYNNFTDVATNMLRRITGTFDVRSRLRHCDSHLSIEDIVSMTLEKIIVLNPVTVSDAYVRITAKTLYLDEVKRKQRLQYTDTQSKDNDMDDVNYTDRRNHSYRYL